MTAHIHGTPQASVEIDSAYSFVPSAGGTGNLTFSKIGNFPSWLSFNSANGAISGVPNTAGYFPGLSIKVTDSSGSTSQLPNFSITVNESEELPL